MAAKKPTAAKTKETAPVVPKEAVTKLVKMKRDAEQYPVGPHECDCHPDEVENFRAGGWQEV